MKRNNNIPLFHVHGERIGPPITPLILDIWAISEAFN